MSIEDKRNCVKVICLIAQQYIGQLTGEYGQQNQTPCGCLQHVVPSGQKLKLSQKTTELFSWSGA